MSENLQIVIACMAGGVCGVPAMIFLTVFGIPVAVTVVDAIDNRLYERKARRWIKRMDKIERRRENRQ